MIYIYITTKVKYTLFVPLSMATIERETLLINYKTYLLLKTEPLLIFISFISDTNDLKDMSKNRRIVR